jgi:hypothetical protein
MVAGVERTAGVMERTKRSKIVDVDRGLVLVRYTGADDKRRPPKVEIVVNPRDEKYIELVLNPDHQSAVLWQPGSCLVMRATRPGQVYVEVLPLEEGGSTAATVQIETLSQGEPIAPSRNVATTRTRVRGESNPGQLSLLGHVAGIGDVVVPPDAWIAGPSAPARIERFSINWPGKPSDLDVCYSVKLARPHAASGRVTELGGYAGTRGRALPIVGLSLELVGLGAADFRLVVEAVFLGAPVAHMTGRNVEMSGPTGREPLVGFRLRLDDVDVPLQPTLAPFRAKSQGKVRVFRSQAAQSRLQSSRERVSDAAE